MIVFSLNVCILHTYWQNVSKFISTLPTNYNVPHFLLKQIFTYLLYLGTIAPRVGGGKTCLCAGPAGDPDPLLVQLLLLLSLHLT